MNSEQYSDYQLAIQLRASGMSYEDMAKKINQPQKKLEEWTAHVQLNDYQKKCLAGKNPLLLSPGRARAIEKNIEKYQKLRLAARKKGYDEASGDFSHVCGAMLYWAEGSKNINSVAFSNTDVLMHQQFMRFLKFLKIPQEKVKFCTTVHNTEGNATHEECRVFWSEKLNISSETIKVYDAKDNRGESKTKSRYPYGVGRIAVYDYTVIQRIYGAIERYVGQEIPYGRK